MVDVPSLGVIGGLSSENSASPHCVKKKHRHVVHTDIWHGLGGQFGNYSGTFSKLSPPMTQDSVDISHDLTANISAQRAWTTAPKPPPTDSRVTT